MNQAAGEKIQDQNREEVHVSVMLKSIDDGAEQPLAYQDHVGVELDEEVVLLRVVHETPVELIMRLAIRQALDHEMIETLVCLAMKRGDTVIELVFDRMECADQYFRHSLAAL